jgi:hypothetical protein
MPPPGNGSAGCLERPLDNPIVQTPTWLLGGKRAPPEDPSEAVVTAACEFALESWQVLPAIWPRLWDWAGAGFARLPVIEAVRNRRVAVQVMARLQHMLLARYTAELDRNHIPYVLLKGDAARVLCYHHVSDRCGVDVDLGIPKQCCRDAEQIALEQGFLQAEWNPQTKRFYHGVPERRAEVEAAHYELGFLARDQAVADLDAESEAAIRQALPGQDNWHETNDGGLACYITLDLHHRLTLAWDMDGSLATATHKTQDGVTFRVPSVPWVIFHIIGKIYLEGVATYRTGGHQFADLLRLVGQLDTHDARTLVRLLERHKFEAPAYYVMRRLPSEFGVDLPIPIEEFLNRNAMTPDRNADAYMLNDLGDVWPKLWGRR